MRHRLAGVVLLATAGVLAQEAGPPTGDPRAPHAAPGELIVKLAADVGPQRRAEVHARLGATRIGTLDGIGAELLRLSGRSIEDALAACRADPDVEFAEANWLYRAERLPDDPDLAALWGLRNAGQTGGAPGADIDAEGAWDLFTGSPDVIVAVLDSGIDFSHPDLAANVAHNPDEIPFNGIDDDANGFVDDVRGWDFVSEDGIPWDDFNHGTHLAGTIGAVGDNGVGVAGVAWRVKLLPLKFLAADGFGTAAAAARAIDYAVERGASIINASWGGTARSEALRRAIERAGDAGVLFVASAGNEGSDNDRSPRYPAGFDLPNVVAVAATDHSDDLGRFSNFGATSVDLAAPGINIHGTLPGGTYGSRSGTSMAAPHVSGALALVLGRFPAIHPQDALRRVLAGVDEVPALAGRVRTGGRLNARRPLERDDRTPPAPIDDLRVSRTDGRWVALEWTATGDDGRDGQAAYYDVRYSSGPLDDAGFAAATRVREATPALPPGSAERVEIHGLEPHNAYRFAVRVVDEIGNASPISTISATTLGPADVRRSPEHLEVRLARGTTSRRELVLENAGQGEARYSTRVVVDPGLPRAAETPLKLLLLESASNLGRIRDALAALPDVESVEVRAIDEVAPTLAELLAFDATIVNVNGPVGERVALGDALAEYAGTGRGVVLALASFVPHSEPLGLFRSEGWSPFLDAESAYGFSSLGAYDAQHPILAGVDALVGEQVAITHVRETAEIVARWANGQPLVATSGDRVVGLNVSLHGSGWDGALATLVRNAARWASRPARWLAVEPEAGAVTGGTKAALAVRFDSRDVAPGTHAAAIRVWSDVADFAPFELPARLHVDDAPDAVPSSVRLDFGTVGVGRVGRRSLEVANRGTLELRVGPARIDAGPFALLWDGPWTLAPGERRALEVELRPALPGPAAGHLVLRSNDPDAQRIEVELRGQGIVPADLEVAPGSLEAVLPAGARRGLTLEIANRGREPLVATFVPRELGAPAALPELLLFEGAESDASPWRHAATRGEEDRWSRSVARAHGGSRSWHVGQHPAEGGDALGSPEVALPGWLEPRLAFWHWADFDDCGGDPTFEPDGGRVEVSTDGGSTWDPARPAGGYGHRLDDVCGNPLADEEAFSHAVGDGQAFMPVEVDLGPWAGERVQVRFHAGWDCGNCGAAEGWYVDDVTIDAAPGPWIRVAPGAATVAPGERLAVAVELDLAGRAAGSYAATIEVTSNDPDRPSVVVPVSVRVDGAPAIEPSVARVDFGDALAGIPVERRLGVANVGTERLHVTGIDAGRGSVVAEPTSFEVDPGRTREVVLTFAAAQEGHVAGELRLSSDDPRTPTLALPWAGRGIAPPEVAVSPTHLAVHAITGEKASRGVRIENRGGGELALALGARDAPGPVVHEDVVGSTQHWFSGQLNVRGNFYRCTASTTLREQRFFLDPHEPTELWFVVYESPTRDGSYGRIHAVDVSPAGPGAGWYGSGEIDVPLVAGRYYLLVAVFDGTSEYYNRQGIVPYPVATAFGELIGAAGWNWAPAASLPPPPAYAVPFQAFASPVAYLQAVRTEAGVDWLALAPRSARLAPGAALDVRLTFDAAGLGSGVREAELVIESDDPHAPSVPVPLTLHVTGAPDVELSAERIDLGDAFVESETHGTLIVANEGVEPLAVAARTGGSPFSVSPSSLLLEPGAAQFLTVRFTPAFASEVGGNLVLTTDDPDEPLRLVELRGRGLDPPEARVLPSEVEVALFTGGRVAVPLNVENRGGSDLEYAIAFGANPPPGWIELRDAEGRVAPGGRAAVMLDLDARGLPGGPRSADLVLHGNDPRAPAIAVPVRLVVADAADVEVAPAALALGAIHVGFPAVREVVVTNAGTEELRVGAIDVAGVAVSAVPRSFALAPGTSRNVSVTVAAAAPGPLSGSLTLTSDDPDESRLAVGISGQAVPPPDLAVVPPALEATLEPGARETRSIEIRNRGDGALRAHVSVERAIASREATLDAPRILVYSDDPWRPPGQHYADLALQRLGLGYTPFYAHPEGFGASLAGGPWDLAVVDHNRFSGFENSWSELEAHVLAGGRLLVSTFDIDGSHSERTTLWTTLGFGAVNSVLASRPVHWWAPDDPLFADPESVPPFAVMTDDTFDDGDRLEVGPAVRALAGYLPAPEPFEAALVASRDHMALVNGFLVSQNDADLDEDGTPDAVELLANEIVHLLRRARWLRVDAGPVEVLPHASVELSVDLDARGLAAGSYEAHVVVIADDPDTPRVEVPVALRVE